MRRRVRDLKSETSKGSKTRLYQIVHTRFFARFLRCDSRTRMKSFLKEIAREFSGNFLRFLCKFLAIFMQIS